MNRLLIFAAIFLSSFFASLWLAAALSLWYGIRYFAPELIVLGALIDAYFVSSGHWPYYTIAATFLVLTTTLAKRNFMIK